MRTNQIYCGDNLEIMREIPNESVDLIYLDPPSFTQRNFINFDDRFKNIDHYINWMGDRLIEMHRILKPIGSIYLHCDWHALHYLKIKMDEIFGYKNFQNEIIWNYGLGAANRKMGYLRKHDSILFYSKTKNFIFNLQSGDVTPSMKTSYCHEDEVGIFMLSKGKKYYLKGGKPLDDVWNDIPTISPNAHERTGYPTQKPKLLLDRIIKVSSNPNCIIFDPFAGSGTTLDVAQKSNRFYIGIDISEYACTIMRNRLNTKVNFKSFHQNVYM